MGLDIMTSDNKKNFHIGYIGFTIMRSLFILHYGKELYKDYNNICEATLSLSNEFDDSYNKLLEKIGDLSILIDHSDCDGELTSDECKQLLPCLFVDEEKIKNKASIENQEYLNRMIKNMYEFIDLIDYCAKNNNIKLIFG